jgi:hypothetical protein
MPEYQKALHPGRVPSMPVERKRGLTGSGLVRHATPIRHGEPGSDLIAIALQHLDRNLLLGAAFEASSISEITVGVVGVAAISGAPLQLRSVPLRGQRVRDAGRALARWLACLLRLLADGLWHKDPGGCQ